MVQADKRVSSKKTKKLVQKSKKQDACVKVGGSVKAKRPKASMEAADDANTKLSKGKVTTNNHQLGETDETEAKTNQEKKRKLVAELQGEKTPEANEESSSKEAKKPKKELTAAEFRAVHKIIVSAKDGVFKCPSPIATFDSTPYGASIRVALDEAGYPAPTPTQAQSWPIALGGRDMITVARTGSGKTLGFLLPVFHSLMQKPDLMRNVRGSGPYVVVLAPTRELACQISEEARKFGSSSGIRTTTLYGGAPKYPQIRAIENGVHVVVATPGRLNDLMEMRKVNLFNTTMLVLDEADRMLDMGFEPQIRTIIDQIPAERQTLFFTATWPKEVERLAHDFVKDPVRMTIGDAGKLNANKSITQNVENDPLTGTVFEALELDREDFRMKPLKVVDERDKWEKLWELLAKLHQSPPNASHDKTIVFSSKKRLCDKIAQEAWNRGFAVDALHGDREQWERTQVMNQYRSGEIRLLIATDVAARGLDVKDIVHVINYDFPVDGVENYVHRIGRTARGDASGVAHTFFTKSDSKFTNELMKVLQGANQEVSPDLAKLSRGGGGGGRSFGFRGRGRGGSFGRGGGGSRGRGGRGGFGSRSGGRKW